MRMFKRILGIFAAVALAILPIAVFAVPADSYAAEFSPEETTNLRFVREDGYYEYYTFRGSRTEPLVLDATAVNNDPEKFPISYQWYWSDPNGSGSYEKLEGATSPTYAITEFDHSIVGETNMGEFRCVIEDGYEDLSYHAELMLQEGLAFTNHSLGYAGTTLGDTVVWDATAENDDGSEITYQWYYSRDIMEEDYVPIEGATDPVFTIESIQESDNGWYQVIVKDATQEISTSNNITIRIETGLEITSPEENKVIQLTKKDIGKSTVLKVKAKNSDSKKYPITYQWFKDGVELEETSNKLVIDNLSYDTLSYYLCTASDGYQSDSVGFEFQSFYFNNAVSTLAPDLGETVTLDMTAESLKDTDITYKWKVCRFIDNGDIDGEGWQELDHTEPILEVTVDDVADYGQYVCYANDGTNEIAEMTQIVPPVDPHIELTDIVAVPGETITISGEARTLMTREMDDHVLVKVHKFDKNGDRIDSYIVGDNPLFGFMQSEDEFYKEDGYYVCRFTVTIPEMKKDFSGNYALQACSARLDGEMLKFSLKIKDYEKLTLESDDISIEGLLHPAADLEIEDFNDDDECGKDIPAKHKVIWKKHIDVKKKFNGDAENYKGDMDVSIKVGEEFEGKKILVYHYYDSDNPDKYEIHECIVKDGKVKISVKSFSPFVLAVDESAQDDTPTETPEDETPDNSDKEETVPDEQPDNGKDEEKPEDNKDETKPESDKKPESEEKPEEKDPNIPQTGDSSSAALWLMITAAAAVGMTVMIQKLLRAGK